MRIWSLVAFRTALGLLLGLLQPGEPWLYWMALGFISSLGSVPMTASLRGLEGRGAPRWKAALLLILTAPESLLVAPVLVGILVAIPTGIIEAGFPQGLWLGPLGVLVWTAGLFVPWLPSVVAVGIWWRINVTASPNVPVRE